MNLPIYYEKKAQEKRSFFAEIKQKTNIFALILLVIFSILAVKSNPNTLKNFVSPNALNPLQTEKESREVFGFAPYWTFDKLDNVDFGILTTLAYFGIDVDGLGNLDKEGTGYEVFKSDRATKIFQKAHDNGTRVALTLTQMDNYDIINLLDNPTGQKNMIDEAVSLIKERGVDGINVDFEYNGDPGEEYRNKFTALVANLARKMHREIPLSRVTVSVYASSIKDPKIYDISNLSKVSDGIFMMAYDFATAGSENAIPTSPLYGYKEGKYWYDISSAVGDFLAVMPARKLILGLPWYGYNYPVYQPEISAQKDYGYYTYYWWRGRRYSRFIGRQDAMAQTYAFANDNNPVELEGWDDVGKVGWKAYKDVSGLWRMIFLDDSKSLGIKYDFAKEKKLGGVGIWALGFDEGKEELWTLLKHKFGTKLAENI